MNLNHDEPVGFSTLPRPFLFIVRGVPGSGKSYISNAIAGRVGARQSVILDPDAIDFASPMYSAMTNRLRAEGVDEKFYPYRFLRERAHRAIEQGEVIIWNQAFTDFDGLQKTLHNLHAHAAEHKLELSSVIIEVTIDKDTAQKRIAHRVARGGHSVADDVLDRFIASFRSFENMGYPVVKVNGADEIAVSLDTISAIL